MRSEFESSSSLYVGIWRKAKNKVGTPLRKKIKPYHSTFISRLRLKLLGRESHDVHDYHSTRNQVRYSSINSSFVTVSEFLFVFSELFASEFLPMTHRIKSTDMSIYKSFC